MATITIVEIIGEVIEDMAVDAEFAEFALDLKEAEDAIVEEAQQALAEAQEEALAETEANSDAIDAGYEKVTEIDENLADQWRFKVETKAEEQNIGLSEENPGTGQSYEDVDPDANPDQADIDEGSTQEDTPANRAKNTNRFLRFARKNWGRVLFGLAVFGVIVFNVFKAAVGGVMRWACRTFTCNDCKPGCSGNCKAFNCDCEKKCEPKDCESIKKFVQNLRKYFLIIFGLSVIVSLALVIWSKSLTLLIILSIVNGLLLLLRGQFGNFVATAICNEEAYDCAVKTGKVNC